MLFIKSNELIGFDCHMTFKIFYLTIVYSSCDHIGSEDVRYCRHIHCSNINKHNGSCVVIRNQKSCSLSKSFMFFRLHITVQFIEVAFDFKLFMCFVGEGEKMLNVFLK